MHQNKIQLISHERQTTPVIHPNRYEYSGKGKWLWIQRICFWILKKLRAYSYDDVVTYQKTTIDTSKIIDALMRNQRDVEMLVGRRAKYLIIGHEAFAELTADPTIPSYLRFQFTTTISYHGRHQLFGLEVVVVPWIEGFFVLPDLEHS